MSLDICKYPLCHQHKVIDIFNASQLPVSFRFFVCLVVRTLHVRFTLNKLLLAQCHIAKYSHLVVQQISSSYSCSIHETSYM